MRILKLLFLSALVSACVIGGTRTGIGGQPQGRQMEHREISEARGIACSQVHDGVAWVVSDRANSPTLHAIDPAGKHLSSWKVEDVENVDCENIATFTSQGQAYVLIGDIGDSQTLGSVQRYRS